MAFTFVSGNVALDLTTTVEHRRADPTDLLRVPGDLSRWCTEAGVVDSPVKVDREALATALRLREAVYRLAVTGPGAADRRLVNQLAKGSPVRVRLAKDGMVTRTGDVEAVLATVARSAIELLGSDSARHIKECAAADCTRLYVDGSRRGSRRWCDMRDCGNRAKVATFRARNA
jgi:predicted RNA-binding Zn ribbon-like protein